MIHPRKEPGPDDRPTIGFQGEPGAFSEQAALALFGGAVRPVPLPSMAAVAGAVRDGTVRIGILPIENTLAGGVVASYDAMRPLPDSIVVRWQVTMPIRLTLLGLRGSTVEGLREVRSHPVALAQIGRFLAAHPHLHPVAAQDTAGSAREVAEEGDPAIAAVAARHAADRYGLEVLAEEIQDRMDNQTRFFILSEQGAPLPPVALAEEGRNTAMILHTANRPGSLVHALRPLAEAGINLSRIESRPADEPWSYRFFLEVNGSAEDSPLAEAVARVREEAQALRILGSYPVSMASGRAPSGSP